MDCCNACTFYFDSELEPDMEKLSINCWIMYSMRVNTVEILNIKKSLVKIQADISEIKELNDRNDD